MQKDACCSTGQISQGAEKPFKAPRVSLQSVKKGENYLTSDFRVKLEKQQYRVIGRHSAVKVCGWTKTSLLDQGSCYKQKFYGIESHRCLQMTPALSCNFACKYCWRAHAQDFGMKKEFEPEVWDDPETIIEGCIEAQRELLTGFGGNEKVNKEKFIEANMPTQVAISLTGEPTLYPHMAELILGFKKRGFSTFLVTNGSVPERLRDMLAKGAIPTNLYISYDTADLKKFAMMDRPMMPVHEAWAKLHESLALLREFDCDTLLRVTACKGINMGDDDIKGMAEVLKKYLPKYLEVKSYMFIGHSMNRMERDNMPSHAEVREYAEKLCALSGYKIKDEAEPSRVVLISRD